MSRKKHKLESFSLSRVLRSESRSTEDFEVMLNNLTLEEVIGLKLEVSSRVINHKLYGLKIFNRIKKICRDAVVNYALSASKTQKEASMFLGMTHKQFYYHLKRLDLMEDDQD